MGANGPSRALGKALQQLGNRVLLTDSSWKTSVQRAWRGCLLTSVIRPRNTRTLTWTWSASATCWRSPLRELNTLATMRFRHEFGHQRMFSLASGQESRRTDKHRASHEHRGQLLGNQVLTYTKLASLLSQGAELYTTHLTDGLAGRTIRRCTVIVRRCCLPRNPVAGSTC